MRLPPAIGEAGLMRFAELIEKRLGLQFDSSSLPTSWRADLDSACVHLKCRSFDAYLQRLESDPSMQNELRELAAKLTIGETYFFRSPEQLSVFSEVALPRLTRSDRPANPDIVRRMFHR